MHGAAAMHLPEQVSLRPSRTLAVAVGAIHSCGVACLLPLTLPMWIKLALAAVLLGSLAAALRGSVLLRTARSITHLALNIDGTLEVLQRDGRHHSAQVAAQTTVFSFLVAIRMHILGERGTRSLVILPDMVGAAEFRRLRVWLRWRTGVSRGAV